ncbi:hypothetical protein K8R42_00660 [bacterium]|nr:hypothetical protein [bacterium]
MSKEQIADLIVSVYNAPAENFILKSFCKAGIPERMQDFRVEFVYQNKHYILNYYQIKDLIHVWVRPEGAPPPSTHALSDENIDGVVDHGTNGGTRLFASTSYYQNGSATQGMEHQSYWQEIYNEALAGLRATIN